MTGVLHTSRINTIEVILSSDKLIKMVNIKIGNEMWRWINQNDTSVGQRKNSPSPQQESNPWPYVFLSENHRWTFFLLPIQHPLHHPFSALYALAAKIKGVFNRFYHCYGNVLYCEGGQNLPNSDWTYLWYHYCNISWTRVVSSDQYYNSAVELQ